MIVGVIMQKNGKWVYKKYNLGKVGLVFSIISLILSIICMFFCIYLENTVAIPVATEEELTGIYKFYANNASLFNLLKECATIVTSIIGASFIVELAFEPKNKNMIYTDFFEQELICNSKFYSTLAPEYRNDVLNALERIDYFNNNAIVSEMYSNIRKRLNDSISKFPNSKYYLEQCSYKVTCYDKNTHFEKRVVRTMEFKSYSKEETINNLCLGEYRSIKIDDLDAFTIESLHIDGDNIDISKIDCIDSQDDPDVLEAQAKYTTGKKYVYKESIRIKNDTSTVVVFEYISRTQKNDIHSTFRVATPCKKFSVDFSIDKNYTLIPIAFGFCDRAIQSPNSSNEKEACVLFNDWVFKDDGVVIILNKNK